MGELARVPEREDAVDEQSVWPLLLAFALSVVVTGLTVNLVWAYVGGVFLAVTIVGWVVDNVRHFTSRTPEQKAEVGLGRSRLWWGSATLVLSEVMLFAAAFVVLAVHGIVQDPDAPDPFQELNTSAVFVASLVLWSSGATGVMAERSLHAGRTRATVGWLIATVTLGTAFFLYQLNEYRVLASEGFTLGSSIHADIFYGITGLHGVHLVAGLVPLAVMIPYVAKGHMVPPKTAPLRATMLYWHFVDIAWVFIYLELYVKVF